MVLLPVKQYYPQTDSATRHGDRMCFSSTCAMAIKYLLPDALKGSNADDDYLKVVLKYGDTTSYQAQVKACEQFGIKATFSIRGDKYKLIKELGEGYPVATGILHKGPATAPRGNGHWMLMVGADTEYGIFHDPYGKMNEVKGDYLTIGSGGQNVKYSWRNWQPRWEVEGAGNGWYLTFRPIVKPAPKPSFENTWNGIKAIAKACGAKFPEVVAAQWALESARGTHLSGKWNFFGIKGTPGTKKETKEFVNGKWITITATFKDYDTPNECINDLVTKWYKDYKTYKGVNRATSWTECCQLLQKEGYATDPTYPQKLITLIKENN
ncbi:MAG: glucosaminidase domain-containing protein [Candidatus Nanopelagicaceae bacterium]